MRNYILHLSILASTFFTYQGFSQYDSLVVEGKIWSEYQGSFNWWGDVGSVTTNNYKFQGDTTLNNKTYKKLFSTWIDPMMEHWSLDSYFREDSMKVYRFYSGQEYLVYDFSIEKGDTINGYDYRGYVDSVDTISILGKLRKRIIFKYDIDDIWIEGIGSIIRPFYPLINHHMDQFWILTCCHQEGQLIYQNDDGLDCYNEYFNDLNSSIMNQDKILIFPNPFNDFTQIQIVNGHYSDYISAHILNFQGQIIKELYLRDNHFELPRGNLPSGLYFIKLIDRKNKVLIEKIVAD